MFARDAEEGGRREKKGSEQELASLCDNSYTLCKVRLIDEISGDNFMFEL